MADNKLHGDDGEQDIVDLVPCPNCNKPLMLLPKNYPLYDLQCTGCSFRAQVKTNHTKPKSEILGAGWEIMNKVLKSGFLVPPLITNNKWEEKGVKCQEIRFYPFIPKKTLGKYKLSPTAKRADYMMFRYVGLNDIPYLVLYKT